MASFCFFLLSSVVEASELTEESLRLLPSMRVMDGSMLLAPGEQCRVCLRTYSPGDYVRRLPCSHKFHKVGIHSQGQSFGYRRMSSIVYMVVRL